MHTINNNDTNNEWIINVDYPYDYITISNILTSLIYYKFHLNIYNFDESYEKSLYNFLKEKNIDIIKTKLCSINRNKPFIPIKKDMLMRIRKR
jgi:hypothetical protein